MGEMSELAPIDVGLNSGLVALIKDEVAFEMQLRSSSPSL